MPTVQFILFNLNMSIDKEDSVFVYLTEDCKESNRRLDEQPFNTISYSGRWTSEEWCLYVLFSLKQICKCAEKRRILDSFNRNRREYTSFDKRFVQFVVYELQIQNPSQKFIIALKKRTKSKFCTLKRRYKTQSRKRDSWALNFPDFEDLIYQEAKKFMYKINNKVMLDKLELEIARYQKQKDLWSESQELKPEEIQPSRRYRVIPAIKTRSLTLKQKQIGTQLI